MILLRICPGLPHDMYSAADRMAVRAFGSLRSSVQVPDMWSQGGGSTLKCWLWPALSKSHAAWQHQKQKPGAAEKEWTALPSLVLTVLGSPSGEVLKKNLTHGVNE